MTARPAEPEELDYLSFVEFALGKMAERVPSIDLTAMRLVLTMHRVTSTLAYDLESSVHRPSGWSWPGFRVLFVLWAAGPLESKRVAELSGMSRAAVSALVNTLQRDGLVSRTQSAHDRRAVVLELTGHGHQALIRSLHAHNERERAWTSALSKSERATLIGLLEKLMYGTAASASKRRF